MAMQPDVRRDLVYFLLGPAVVAIAAAALFHLAPWPVFSTIQAGNFHWATTLGFLAVGALGAALSSRIGTPSAPQLGDGAGWRRLLLWGLGAGLAYAAFDLGLLIFTPVGAHSAAVDRAAGHTWFNVALPFSLLHYAHAAILSECAYRLGAVVIPTWLVSTLLLRGRWPGPVFWTFAGLAAFIEPLEQAIISKRLPLVGMAPLDQAITIEGVASELIFALMLRRFGWPAPILMRYGFYLLYRVTAGYFFPHTSGMYPGPH
jgi:hypothetical protein